MQRLLWDPEDEPTGYLRYLELQTRGGKEAYFVFLIPPDWQYEDEVQKEIDRYTVEAKARLVRVQQVTWSDFYRLEPQLGDAQVSLVEEFRALLENRFGETRFKETEITSMSDGQTTLQGFVKFARLIGELRREVKRCGRSVTELQTEKDEFGFYDKGRSLFVGCSPEVWGGQHPLSIAMRCSSDTSRQAFLAAVETCYHQAAKIDGDWIYAYVPEADVQAGASAIWAKLEKIWDASGAC